MIAEATPRIELRVAIMLGFFVALFAGAILGVVDQIFHVKQTTNQFWGRPTQIAAIVAYIYLLSPFFRTLFYAIRTGRLTNAYFHWAYSAFLTVMIDIGLTYGILFPFLRTLKAMPQDRFLAIGLAVFLGVVIIIQILTRTNVYETGSLYGIFFPRFRTFSASAPSQGSAATVTVVDEPRVVSGTYLPSNGASTATPRAGDIGSYDSDQFEEPNVTNTQQSHNRDPRQVAHDALQQRGRDQHQEFLDRSYANHQNDTKARNQASLDNHNRQNELNRQHAADNAQRATDDRAAAQQRHQADMDKRAADDRAAAEQRRRDDAARIADQRRRDDDDRRRRN